jgi:hypothetical protein
MLLRTAEEALLAAQTEDLSDLNEVIAKAGGAPETEIAAA